jgi:multidrug efflux pump subunit AcrB
MTPAGFYETPSDRVRIRVSGDFESVDSIREIGIQAGGRLFRLGDIATVERGFADPPTPRMRVQGQDAIGIGIAMNKGGDVIRLGDRLRAEARRLQQTAAGHRPARRRRPAADRSPVDEPVHVVAGRGGADRPGGSFISLGLRTGAVVALSIPLVLAITFLLMYVFGIDLQRISLGALVIALGLLVDDAIIAVEMMVVKMEQGWDRFRAATFAYTSTAFPMLTGTLITAVGFMPVGLAKSGAGEYTFSIFAVVSIALLVSWVVAVVFTPYLGYLVLDAEKLRARRSSTATDATTRPSTAASGRPSSGAAHRWLVIARR